MSKLPTLLELLKAGAHFGHQKSRWHPKMKQYLFGSRGGIHIIDLEKTLVEMEKTLAFVRQLAAEGKVVLFVGTKRQTRDILKIAAESCQMPYLSERWIGGLLTNFDEVKRRLKKYISMQGEMASGEVEKYTKKEQLKFKKELEKMERYLSGLTGLEKIPDAVYVADMRTEKTAITEAKKKNIPIIGICDSNVNPDDADYIIPMNDDAVNSIRLAVDLVVEAIAEGKKEWEKKKMAMPKEEKKSEAPKREKRSLAKEGSE